MKKILLVIFVFSFAWTQCDANGDGELDILDIIEEVNCILDGCWKSEDECERLGLRLTAGTSWCQNSPAHSEPIVHIQGSPQPKS